MPIEDETIKIEIKEITGQEPRYDAWSVIADVCIKREAGNICQKTVGLNVLKGDEQFKNTDSGTPRIVERIKKKYTDEVRDYPEYQAYSSQVVEDEKAKANELLGEEFEF